MELKDIINNQRDFFNTDVTKTVSYRIEMLQRLKEAIKRNEALLKLRKNILRVNGK